MLEFIPLLRQRYQVVLNRREKAADRVLFQQRIDQLTLAEAFVRKGQTLGRVDGLPLQMAVIGPTQVGKSSVVNVLMGCQAAGVSPLAGYTVHPQGFCHDLPVSACAGLQRYFGGFRCIPQQDLDKSRYDCYSLAPALENSGLLPACVLWDTPDFDSIDSRTYREGVIRTLALADAIILVVSKEKYADQSVWEMMSVLESLNQPTLICLNKLVEGSEQVLLPSLQDKWQKARQDPFPEVVCLHYQKLAGVPIWPDDAKSFPSRLAQRSDRKKHAQFEQQLLQKHWQQWLQPILEEHQAFADWEALVDNAINQALGHYQRDFLNHPQHYETFQQALAELLTLLEIPGLAGFLTGVRKALTWPVRQMMKLGQKRLHITDSSREVALLNQIAEHALIRLNETLLDNNGQGPPSDWWQELAGVLRNQKVALLQNFSLAARAYHLDFQHEVEQTAQSLYLKLQEQPLVLNSLRATRVTADAAVIALTLHTGGIGVHDLVIAPAMLTLTSLLAESAIGGYVHKIEAQLKQRQLDTVKQILFMGGIRAQLLALPGQLSALAHFNISIAQLNSVEQQLKEKRHGLRLL